MGRLVAGIPNELQTFGGTFLSVLGSFFGQVFVDKILRVVLEK